MNAFDDIKAVTLELTNRCDLRCRICNIWREEKTRDLSADNVAKLLEPLPGGLSIALTGGEPFLHPEFPEIFKYLFRLFLMKKAVDINIATNCYSVAVTDFLAGNRRFLFPFSLSVSLDGMEKSHNMQRGKKNAFSATLKNIIAVKRLNCPVSIKFVITSINYRDFENVYRLSRKLKCPFYPKLFETSGNYYHRNKEFPRLGLPEGAMEELLPRIRAVERLEGEKNRNSLTYFSLRCLRMYAQTKKKSSIIKKCLTPRHSLFVTSRGDIYSCLYRKNIASVPAWPKLDLPGFLRIKQSASLGDCPGCLSYHGFLREFNFR